MLLPLIYYSLFYQKDGTNTYTVDLPEPTNFIIDYIRFYYVIL